MRVLSILSLSSVCESVCLSQKVLPGNRPQYLSKMKSDHHKTFRITSWGSPNIIHDEVWLFWGWVEVVLSRGNTPQYLSQMKSDLHETFSKCQGWSPELIDNIHGRAHACMHAQHLKTYTTWGNKQSLIAQPNEVRSSQNYSCMSRLVFCVDL